MRLSAVDFKKDLPKTFLRHFFSSACHRKFFFQLFGVFQTFSHWRGVEPHGKPRVTSRCVWLRAARSRREGRIGLPRFCEELGQGSAYYFIWVIWSFWDVLSLIIICFCNIELQKDQYSPSFWKRFLPSPLGDFIGVSFRRTSSRSFRPCETLKPPGARASLGEKRGEGQGSLFFGRREGTKPSSFWWGLLFVMVCIQL